MISILISILIKIYFFLNSFQKSYYEYKGIIKTFLKKYYIIYLSSVFIVILNFFKNVVINHLLFLAISIQIIYLIKKTKVFLKITKRIVRLFITIVLEILLLTFFIPYYLIDLFIPLLVVLANIINHPIEVLINKRYIKKAKRKIDNISAVKIAITGSYGKTSTKNYIADVLKNKYIVKETPKSYNTPLGIALFINKNKFHYSDFIIYEFGARKVGDIRELQQNYNYDIAIVTGIGKMHIDTFKTLENIIEEKMRLVSNSKIVILNCENELIRNYPVDNDVYTYGFAYGKYQARNLKTDIFESEFDLYIDDKYIRSFKLNLIGKGAILNVLPVLILCDLYKVSYEYIEHLKAVENRLSSRKIDDYYILDDAYNSNILGAIYALEVLKTHNGKKYLITPGFAEMDLIEEELIEEYSNIINETADCVILVKNNFTIKLSEKIKIKEVFFTESFKKGFNTFLENKEQNSIILIENDLLE